MTQQRWFQLAGVVLAVACYSLAETVLAGTDATEPVKMVGGLVLGWLGLRQPGQPKGGAQ